ncbi:MAG: hypothetical protein ACK5LL_15905 [Suipraeoptans sp.]
MSINLRGIKNEIVALAAHIIKYFQLCFIWLALTLVQIISYSNVIEPMNINARASSKTLSYESNYPTLWGESGGGSVLDNFTDALMIQNAIHPSSGKILYDAVSVSHMQYGDKMMPVDDLASYVAGEEGGYAVEYSRYWHGYLIFLKPLLMFLTYAQIRVLNAVLQALLFILLLYMMRKTSLTLYILPFIVSWLAISPWVIPYSMQLSCIYYLSLIGSLVLLKFYNRLKPKIYIYFFIIGMLTSYFDLLTWPVASLGLPLVFLLLLELERRDIKKKFLKIIGICVNWSLGYIGMWASKWILSELVLGSGSFSKSIGALRYRASDTSDDGAEVSLTMVFRQSLGRMLNPAFMIVGILLALVLLILCTKKLLQFKSINDILQVVLPFVIVALIPFVWYALTRNHSYSHPSLVYRGLWMSVFAGFSAMVAFIRYIGNKPEYEEKTNG